MKTESLGNIVTIVKGKKPNISQLRSKDSVRVLQIEDLRSDNSIKYTDELDGVFASEDDILIAWDGANAGTVGFNKSGFVGSTLAVLKKIPGSKFYTPFIARFLQSQFRFLQRRAEGAVIPHLNRRLLENLKIPFFLEEEQKEIAELLERVESLLTMRNESLQILNELEKSYYYDNFVPIRRHSVLALGDCAVGKYGFRTGPFGSDLRHSEFKKKGDVKVLGIDNVVNNYFEEGASRFISFEKYRDLKRYTIYPGDVLVSIMGTTGRTAVVPQNIPLAINTKHLAALTLDVTKLHPKYLSYAIRLDPYILRQLRDRARGAIMDGLNLELIKALKIGVPDINIQREFVENIENIEVLKVRYKHSRNELSNLYSALEYHAFRGSLNFPNSPLIDVADSYEQVIKEDLHMDGSPEIDPLDLFETDRLEQELEDFIYYSSLNWEKFLKKHFAGKVIDIDEVAQMIHNRSRVTSDDFNYESFREFVFKELAKPGSFLKQFFDDATKQLRVHVYETTSS